jgi:hypothetical protein
MAGALDPSDIVRDLGDGRGWIDIEPFESAKTPFERTAQLEACPHPGAKYVAMIEDQATHGTFTRGADVMMGFKPLGSPLAGSVEVSLGHGGTIPCVQEGEWWALTIPIFHNRTFYNTLELRVDGKIVGLGSALLRMLWLTMDAREAMRLGPNATATAEYSTGTARYCNGLLQVLPKPGDRPRQPIQVNN